MKFFIALILFYATSVFSMFYEPDTGIVELDKVCARHNIFTKNSSPEYQFGSFINPEEKKIIFDLKNLELTEKMVKYIIADFKNVKNCIKNVEYYTKNQLLHIKISDEGFELLKKDSFIVRGKIQYDKIPGKDYN